MKSIVRFCFVVLVALALPALSPIPASAATLTVNVATDNPPGDGICDAACTLRDAILAADSTTEADIIEFDIPGPSNPVVIDVETSELPTVDQPVTIDGFSDPDSAKVELHDLNGNAGTTADGLTINGANITIKGLVIRDFDNDGIDITTNATEVRIESNFIGTDINGATDQGNGGQGMDVQGDANSIGGAGVGNVISGNAEHGIRIAGPNATGNLVEGNFIGITAAGNAPLGNTLDGIAITSTSTPLPGPAVDNVVGGTSAALRNVISANGQTGVHIFPTGMTASPSGNIIQGNYVGVAADGATDLGNGQAGVQIEGSSTGNRVGGTSVGAGNLISFNGFDGIRALDDATTGNLILANSISSNDQLGIDLEGGQGVSPNDLGDADTGPNNLQNFPGLTSAASSATTTTIGGTLNSEANKEYRLEFFSNSACDASGNGEGQTFLGTRTSTTDGAGNAAFTASLSVAVAVGHVVTATATEIPANNTSEFSECRTVAFDPTPPVSPDTTPPTTPTTNAGPKFQKQLMFPVTWSASTDATGPVRYDVRYREAPYNGAFGGFVNWQASITTTSAQFTGTPGTTYCFSARAIDGAGNASPYGAEGCTAVPVDNPTFKHRGKWAKRTGAGYYLNTFSRTKRRGAALNLAGVQAMALSIIVTKCRRCGIIKVFFKGDLLKRVNLRSKAAARKKLRLVNLTTFTSVQTGTVRVRVVSRGKLVIIEGLGVSAV